MVRETLYLHLRNADAEAVTAYAVVPVGLEASVIVQHASLRQVLAEVGGRRLVVFVGTEAVRLSRAEVPLRQPAKVLQTVPFLLEEQFAEEVESLHFALGPRQRDHSFPVAAVSRQQMERWLAPLREAGVEAEVVMPDVLCLPLSEGGWGALVDVEQVTVRTGEFTGFCCAPEDAATLLELADAGVTHPLRVIVARDAQLEPAAWQRPLEVLAGYADPLEALVRHYQPSRSINLLQGAYSRHKNLERLWRPWRLPAALAAALFGLAVTTNIAHAIRDGRAAAAQAKANEQRFKELFPDQPITEDLGLQIQQQRMILGGRGRQGGLLPLLAQAATGLSRTPGLTLQTLQYRDGALIMDLDGSDLQALEKLRDWFSSHPGSRLQVETANAGENGVQIRVKLTPA